MRGVVSLAGALALPTTLPNGQPFPARGLLLFITFIVILVTLVAQGLTLPLLIDGLNVRESIDEKQEERRLRRQMAVRAVTHLEANHSAGSVEEAWSGIWEGAGDREQGAGERRRGWTAGVMAETLLPAPCSLTHAAFRSPHR